MTFRERQSRLTKFVLALAALALLPLLMPVLNFGEFTPAGLVLYCALVLAVAIPMASIGMHQARGLRHPHTK